MVEKEAQVQIDDSPPGLEEVKPVRVSSRSGRVIPSDYSKLVKKLGGLLLMRNLLTMENPSPLDVTITGEETKLL
jgi:hypothetical protein